LPKLGNSMAEFEDAFACDDASGRFAIADGASESMFAGEWAQALCEEFLIGPPVSPTRERGAVGITGGSIELGPWLGRAKRRWRKAIGPQPDDWHVQEKLRDGAFATFLGLQIESAGGEARWRAVAIGDSCLFLVRGNSLRKAFPIENAGAFTNRPDLIGSRQNNQVHASAIRGTLAAGDRILLATDALAQWFLTRYEAGQSPWSELGALTDESFAGWVENQRVERRLRNDDVTLLIVEVGGSGKDL
jgi:hypothetical protein